MRKKITRSTQCGNQNCGKSFKYTYDLESVAAGITVYNLPCPFCQTRQDVPLQSVRTVKMLKDGTQQEIMELTLPERPIGKVGE